MNADGLVRAIKRSILVKRPMLIWGDSGIGKTHIVGQVADELQRELLVWNAVLYDQLDFRGIPEGKDGLTHFLPPEFLPRGNKPTIIFMDEINRGAVSVQNALFRLIETGRLGDYVMPDTCAIIAAANRSGKGVVPMPKPLKKRFCQVTLEVDVDQWCKWAVKYLKPVNVAFIRWRPDLLHMPDSLCEHEDASPCPRTWEYLDQMMPDVPEDIDLEINQGIVGQGTAIEHMAFMQLFNSCAGLIDSILLNPLTAHVPDISETSTLFAVSSALARRATIKTFDRIVQYTKRLPSKEYAVYCVKDAVRRDDKLRATPAFNTWAIDNADVVF